MCGIAGVLLASNAANPRMLHAIQAMTDTLYHRGPDDAGIWMDEQAGLALGHRRLAIVDLSEAGHEPMLSHGEGLVMTYNGEVYNFAGLRLELEALGHSFRGHCDAEVMLAAFEQFGIEPSLQRFAGMFAFGVWDRRARVLHLMRDRMGKKPLYVALAGGALLFASELRAIRAFPGFRSELDPQAIAAVLRHGWVPNDQCVWQGVFKLSPGTILSVCADDLAAADVGRLRARIRPWWSLAEVAEAGQRQPFAPDPIALEEQLDALLRVAVGERMLADVPLGAFLSSGIDSATVVALMQAQSTRPVRTFTIGFGEAGYNEADGATAVARHLGTEHTEFHVTPAEARAVIPDLPRIWDEPFADESQIPMLLVAQLARQHVTVALSGDGGDECFGGYTRHFMPVRLAGMMGLPLALRRAAGSVMRTLHPEVLQGMVRAAPLPASLRAMASGDSLAKIARVIDARDDGALYERLTRVTTDPALMNEGNAGAVWSPPLPDALGRMIYRDMAGYLPDDVLVKVDRATMAVALEARCPLLDHRVIEFAWRLPAAMKVHGGKGKWLLRRVLSRYVPESLFERPKHGFNVPVGAWLKGPLREWAEELLSEQRLRREGLMNVRHVRTRWQHHLTGRRDHAYELWAILMVQAWLDASREPAAPPYARGRATGSPAARRSSGSASTVLAVS
jgi:asparagine synthase (glutamine-hydrolysing)